MSLVSPVFEQHYNEYLLQIARMDLKVLAPLTGGRLTQGAPRLEVPFFNRPYTLSAAGIFDGTGRKPDYSTCTILCRYLIMAGDRAPGDAAIIAGASGGTAEMVPGSGHKGEWLSFRDLKDSGPLTVYFRDNVETVISRSLAGRLPLGAGAFSELCPSESDRGLNYDLVLEINALPMMPMLVLANDAEEGFPATCSVLFRPDVERVLDAECIAMAGYRLAEIISKQFCE